MVNRQPRIHLALLVILGVVVSESESSPSVGPSFLELKFKWNDQEAIAARGIVYGMEYPRIEHAVSRSPSRKGAEVVELSPLPYRFPQRMQAKSINAYLDPPLSIDAGTLKIFIVWNLSPTALRNWMENALHPSKWGKGDSAEIEERMESWAKELDKAPPVHVPIQALRVTRTFKGEDTKFDTVQVGKSVLEKGSVAEFELSLPMKTADEEWIILDFPDFSIKLERPKNRTPVEWLSPRMKAARSEAENKTQESPAALKVKPSRKYPFWQFWKKGE